MSDKRPLMDSQLPTYPTPTVTLFREQLARFRDDYGTLVEFAATVCDVDPRELCALDLDRWLYRERGIATDFMAALLSAREDTDE